MPPDSITPTPKDTTISEPATVPSEAVEAPTSEVVLPPVIDTPSVPEPKIDPIAQAPEPEKTAQPEAQNEPDLAPEPVAEPTQTAQPEAQNEPLRSEPTAPFAENSGQAQQVPIPAPATLETAEINASPVSGNASVPPVEAFPAEPAQPPPVAGEAAAAPAPTTVSVPVQNGFITGLLVKARAVFQARKRKKLDRIISEITAKGAVGNDEVVRILRVSRATAFRYLSQLEKEGRIRQVGKTGRKVTYEIAK